MSSKETVTGRGQLLPEDEDYEWPAPDLTEDEWRQFIAYTLHDELADPRDDFCGDTTGLRE